MHKKRGTATDERFHSWSEENNNSLKLVAIRKQLHITSHSAILGLTYVFCEGFI